MENKKFIDKGRNTMKKIELNLENYYDNSYTGLMPNTIKIFVNKKPKEIQRSNTPKIILKNIDHSINPQETHLNFNKTIINHFSRNDLKTITNKFLITNRNFFIRKHLESSELRFRHAKRQNKWFDNNTSLNKTQYILPKCEFQIRSANHNENKNLNKNLRRSHNRSLIGTAACKYVYNFLNKSQRINETTKINKFNQTSNKNWKKLELHIDENSEKLHDQSCIINESPAIKRMNRIKLMISKKYQINFHHAKLPSKNISLDKNIPKSTISMVNFKENFINKSRQIILKKIKTLL